MMTLDNTPHLPDHVMFSVVGEDAFLLNTQTNKYFLLEEVGARLWELLKDGKLLKEAYQILLGEFDVDPVQLEQDLLELLEQLQENGLVGII
jgi:hypothetical protein